MKQVKEYPEWKFYRIFTWTSSNWHKIIFMLRATLIFHMLYCRNNWDFFEHFFHKRSTIIKGFSIMTWQIFFKWNTNYLRYFKNFIIDLEYNQNILEWNSTSFICLPRARLQRSIHPLSWSTCQVDPSSWLNHFLMRSTSKADLSSG